MESNYNETKLPKPAELWESRGHVYLILSCHKGNCVALRMLLFNSNPKWGMPIEFNGNTRFFIPTMPYTLMACDYGMKVGSVSQDFLMEAKSRMAKALSLCRTCEMYKNTVDEVLQELPIE